MAKSYHQYCPVAHALDLVGERWSLLVVASDPRPLRYSDLIERLGCPTNVLATRLRQLEQGSVIAPRKLPPPAASTIYELTDGGRGCGRCCTLAHWGARSLGPPTADGRRACTGWLANALEWLAAALGDALRRVPRRRRVAWVEGRRASGPSARPRSTLSSRPIRPGFYHLLIDGDVDAVQVEGDRSGSSACSAPATAVAVAT